MAEFSDYVWLVGDEAAGYLAHLAGDSRSPLQQIKSLRREMTAERARLLVEQVDLRRKAIPKFGSLASQFFFTPQLLQQATDVTLAGYKTARCLPLGEETLMHDYCCGIGGDLALFATRGPTIGWDLDQVACLLASANLEVTSSTESRVKQADVSELTPASHEAWHVDPDRRAGGTRSTTLERHSPGPKVIDRWRLNSATGAVKLAPAAEPPATWQAEGELEWISTARECRQLVVWFGKLTKSPGVRRATRLVSDELGGRVAGSIAGKPGARCDSVEAPGRFLYDPDSAVLAAHLLGQLAVDEGLASLGSGAAYLTGDRAIEHPLLQTLVVEDCLPLRGAAVAQHLAARGIGRVEIKKRGVTIDPETFRRQLKLRGDREATVVLTRIGKRQVAIIAQRPPTPQG